MKGKEILKLGGDVEVDLDAREIRREGELVLVQPRVFDLLQYLITHRERVVTKSELLETLWSGQVVVPDVLTTAFYSLRQALRDSPKNPRYVRTVHRVGYQLVADVMVKSVTLDDERSKFPARDARHAAFVGRRVETALFDEMLTGQSSVQLLFVHGLPGIGKTTLFQELLFRCGSAGVEYVLLSDEAAGPPFVDAFLRSLARALGCESSSFDAVVNQLTTRGPVVLFVDDMHLLHGVDEWLRQALWPVLASHVRLVLAGRRPPSARWRCDPAWAGAAREIELSGLTAEEAHELFSIRGAPTHNSDRMWRQARGHPLALALAADVLARDGGDGRDSGALDILDHEDAIETLVGWFTDRIGMAAHQQAFEMACLFDEVSPRMLAKLDPPTADESMRWLETLSFIERTGETIRIHALVRDAVVARLGRRDPSRLADLIERGHRFFLDAFKEASDPATRLLITHQFLGHGRHVPALRALYLASDDGPVSTVQPAAPRELPYLVELVARDEGVESSAVVQRWLEHPQTRVWSVRDDKDNSTGFLMALRLSVRDRNAAVGAADPIVEAIFDFVEQQPGALPNDEMIIHRSLITRDGYQLPSSVTRYLHAVKTDNLVWHGTHSPTIAHLFSVYAEPDIWTPVASSVGFVRLTDHEVTFGTRRFAPFHREVRTLGVDRWLADMGVGLVAGLRALAAG